MGGRNLHDLLPLPYTEETVTHVAGRIRLLCDLASFTYAVQPNDHTYGGAAGQPAPEVMIAVNDEASGMILDALNALDETAPMAVEKAS